MQKHLVQIILVGLSIVSVWGCADLSHRTPPGAEASRELIHRPQHFHDLAGTWEYRDKTGSYTVTLNEKGKGPYDWEDGWFETLELNDGVWKGIWRQPGNDREGGFELQWADDSPVARGSWWYTRIGKDFNPLEPGGSFTMKPLSTFLTGRK